MDEQPRVSPSDESEPPPECDCAGRIHSVCLPKDRWAKFMRAPRGRRRRSLVGPGDPTPEIERWATKISETYGTASRAAVSAVLDVGAELAAAQRALVHGGWLKLFRAYRGPGAIKDPVPFSASTARRLMRIAENPVLSDRAHVHALPPSWGTLYELSKIDRPTLTTALAAKRIHPDMTRREACALRRAAPQAPRPARPDGVLVDYHDEVAGHLRIERRRGQWAVTVGPRGLCFGPRGDYRGAGRVGLPTGCPECQTAASAPSRP